jgi:tetratricopeptide (TPR) repeat protein
MKVLLALLALVAAPLRSAELPPPGLDPAVVRLVAELEASVAAEPDSAAAHADLGLAFEANLLWENALEAYARAANLEPSNPDYRLHVAIAQRETGDFEASLATLEKLVESHPDYAPAIQRLGAAYLESGDGAGARRVFMSLVQLDSELPEGHAGLGDALLRDGETEMAIRQLEIALGLDPAYASAHYLLGQAYRSAGLVEPARRHLAYGQDAQPRFVMDPLSRRAPLYSVNVTSRIDQAMGYLGERRPDKAVALLQTVLADHPENVTVLNNLAIAYMHGGNLPKAQATLERALSVDDRKFSTYLNLSALAQRRNQPEEALRWADEAVVRGPDVARVHTTRAAALLRLRRMDDAIGSFEAALEADFREQEPYLALANLELRRGNAEVSAGYSRRALQVWPDLLPAYLLLSHATLELGNTDEAREAIGAVRALAPDHPQLAEFDQRLRGLEEASE